MLGAVKASRQVLDQIVVQESRRYGVDPNLVRAIIRAESNWDILASRFESKLGESSIGLMQTLVSTARDVLNKPSLTIQELYSPNVNIKAGTKYLSQLKSRFPKLEDTISAYNAGRPIYSSRGGYVNQKYVDKVKGFMGLGSVGIQAGLLEGDMGRNLLYGALVIGGVVLLSDALT